jgi:hypothetical protein
MLGVMSVFSFDFLSFECSIQDETNYFTSLYLWCVLPICVSFLILTMGGLRALFEKNRTDIMNSHFWGFLLWTYMVLPSVSSKQLQSLDCVPMNGDRYVRTNTAIDCESSSYKNNLPLVIFFIFLYHSVPLLWFWLLHQKRDALNPSTTGGDLELALYVRKNNHHLAPLRFLFVDYKCSKWWFEIADMYRRIAFIGLIPLISSKAPVRASLGLILAIVSMVIIRELQPYQGKYVNYVANMAQVRD